MAPCWGSYEFAQSGCLLWDCTAREAASLPYSFVGVLWGFARPGSSFLACTARAAGSRPYAGWTMFFTAQKRYRALPAKLQLIALIRRWMISDIIPEEIPICNPFSPENTRYTPACQRRRILRRWKNTGPPGCPAWLHRPWPGRGRRGRSRRRTRCRVWCRGR